MGGNLDTGEGGTGQVTNGTFSTPPISIETVHQGTGLTVFADASFSLAAPATGSIDSDGNIRFQANVNVHLDIEVANPPVLAAQCDAGPISLTLDSTAPWNPTTKRVALRDADFTIPETPETPDCIDVIAGGVNDLLQGSGHRLEMTVEGDLVLPPPPGCDTTNQLVIAPSGGTRLGEEVTFTATVAEDAAAASEPACQEVPDGTIPTGLVEFKAGATSLGTSTLDGSGVATLATTGIPAGTFPMTATYRGDSNFSSKTSAAQSYKVAAPVIVTPDLPDTIEIAGGLAEFDVKVTNTGLGADIINARLQLTLRDPVPALVELEWWDGAAWVPATLPFTGTAFAAISPATGFALPAGTEVVRKVRLGFGNVNPGMEPNAVRLAFEVIEVDPVTGLPEPAIDQVNPSTPNLRGRALSTVQVVEGVRRPTTLDFGRIAPHTLRQGQTARLDFLNSNQSTAAKPQGYYEVLLDGRPVPARQPAAPPAFGLQLQVPSIDGNGAPVSAVEFPILDDGTTGSRMVTLRYSGDENYEPGQWSTTVYVEPSRGTTYACGSQFFSSDLFYVNMTAHANFGKARAAGSTVNLQQLDVTMFADRGDAPNYGGAFGPDNPVVPVGTGSPFTINVNEVNFDFGTVGTGTATSFTAANNFPMDDSTLPRDPNPDMVFGFTGETGSIAVAGAPGDTVPVDVTRVQLVASFLTLGDPVSVTLTCTPVGTPIHLGDITVAGTTLIVDAPEPTRMGDQVTLSAKVAPAGVPGTVEFLDGDESITIAPVASDGTVTVSTDALSVGTHDLRARFYSGLAANSTTSAAVNLTVLPETDCAAFAEEGNEAVVRLVYMELLRRCPDQAGFDYWLGRLDGGTSPKVFARTISRTPEAVGVVVDDAYQTMLGRSADAAGKTFWVERMRTGSGRYDQLLAQLGASPEFWAKSGSTNGGFVTRVYEQLLHRSPDQGGLDFWVGRLDAGTLRGTLILQLANLDEPLGAIVDASYDEILSRAPASGERGDGIDHLRSTGDRSGLYAQLIGRPEFSTRAGTFPNPED